MGNMRRNLASEKNMKGKNGCFILQIKFSETLLGKLECFGFVRVILFPSS